MEKIGLVLEGGGMRGAFTIGVLDYFMEQDLYFPYVIGVSAGACNGISYIAKQPGRSRKININYIRDHRYLSLRNYIREKSLFGMNFIFNELPNRLEPFDYEGFNESTQRFVVGTTDCVTGEPVYFENDNSCDITTILKASSSLPFISPIVEYSNYTLLDGGISDPIPIKKALADGNSKNVVILTKNKGYRKKPFRFNRMVKLFYAKYPGIEEAILNRYRVYNETIDYLSELEKQGKVYIIRPQKNLQVDRLEKNPEKIRQLCDEGYKEADKCFSELLEWMSTQN